MSTHVPGVARGVLLKSKAPMRYESTDRQGPMRAGRRSFNVSSAFWMMRLHRWRGKFGSQVKSLAMRWALNVCILLYAIRDHCRPGGTSWRVSPASLINFFIRADHSLSIICKCG